MDPLDALHSPATPIPMSKILVTKIQFAAPSHVQVISEPVEFLLAPHDILLETRFSLVSTGTELAKLTGLQEVVYPFDPGNRACGRVIAKGSEVSGIEVGELAFSYTPHWSHTKANRLWVKVPELVNERFAAFAGMASVGMTALRVGQVEIGDLVVVLGMGLVGNLAAQLCQAAGAEVIAADLSPVRLAMAHRCGLQNGIDVSQPHVRDRLLDITAGQEPDVIVEASGTPEGALLAVQLTGQDGLGNVVLLGSPRRGLEADITPFLKQVHLWRKGSVNLMGAHEWRYPLWRDSFTKHSIERNFDNIYRLMAEEKLCLEPLVSFTSSPHQAAKTFAAMQKTPDETVGVLFDWTEQQ